MASITLKSLPASLHRALKTRAARHKRSLSSEVVATLEASVAKSQPVDVDALLERARELRSKLKLIATPEEIDRFKREGRE
jgi:plasmid stability protein